MMELMMAEQAAARREHEAQKQAQERKADLGGGFKKGFLGGQSKKTTPKPTQSKDEIIHVSAPSSSSSKAKKDAVTALTETVQARLSEEQSPLLQQLRGGAWANDDLMKAMQTNPVLSRGLQDPRCVAAVELLQKDPSSASRLAQQDPSIAAFLQEFGRVMSSHFEQLALQQEQGKAQEQVRPAGPLLTEALSRQADGKSPSATPSDAANDAQVQAILQDKELYALLMNPDMQQIILDCNDPVKFASHMRDKEVARKLKLLNDAGLVRIAS